MSAVLEALAEIGSGGVITSASLRVAGLHPMTIQRMSRGGPLVQIRRGCYVLAERWATAGIDERYRIRIHAEAASARAPLLFSHHSAAALHGLPSIGEWPLAVHVTDTDSNGGRSGGRRCVHRSGPSPETVVVDGLVVTALARTLADMAIAAPWESSVPMLDAALRRAALRPRSTPSLVTANAVLDEIDAIAPVRGRTRAGSAVRFSVARSANAGESLSRVRMYELGFEIPELQVRFDGVLGSHAVVDFFWRRLGLVGEFDGRHKYTRSAEVSGLDPATVVFREKQCEDALRRMGLSVIRWDWPMLFRPAEFARLLLEAGVHRATR